MNDHVLKIMLQLSDHELYHLLNSAVNDITNTIIKDDIDKSVWKKARIMRDMV